VLSLVNYYKQPTYALQGSQGSIYTQDQKLAQAYQETLTFFQKSVQPENRNHFLVLPDAALLNFLSGTHSPVKETFFNPLVLAHPTEEQSWIISLDRTPPAYIVLVNRPSAFWGGLSEFNPGVYQWIRSQHQRVACFGQPPLVEVFTSKNSGRLATACKA
jgi:hypothetical protein